MVLNSSTHKTCGTNYNTEGIHRNSTLHYNTGTLSSVPLTFTADLTAHCATSRTSNTTTQPSTSHLAHTNTVPTSRLPHSITFQYMYRYRKPYHKHNPLRHTYIKSNTNSQAVWPNHIYKIIYVMVKTPVTNIPYTIQLKSSTMLAGGVASWSRYNTTTFTINFKGPKIKVLRTLFATYLPTNTRK
jgi:hypothetical protein